MAANVPLKFLFGVSNNIVIASGDDSAKKGAQLSLTKESYVNKIIIKTIDISI